MLTVEAAQRRILALIPPNGGERVDLGAARDRVLAEDVASGVELPRWPGSAMDGYAVRAADVPGRLQVLETIPAGGVPTHALGAGQASRIMTGAPVPEGADAVVMVEDTADDGEHVVVRVAAQPGQHIRPRGSEVARGRVVLRRGQRISPGALGVLAALGIPSVRVFMRPRVGVLSTGDELVEPGFAPGPGQIWSSNSFALMGLVEEAGGEPVHLGNVLDRPEALAAAFRDAMGCDVVVSTGGVSVGDYDHVKDVLAGLGVAMDFWRVAMKPGKPLAFGRLGDTPVFGLPGNPVSCMVNFLQFVRPLLRKMLGDPRPFLPVVEATMTGPWQRRGGRPELVRVRLEHREGGLFATITGGQGSAHLLGMADAHGFALLDADQTRLEGRVRVQVFDPAFLAGASPDYGLASFGGEHLDVEGC
jgi:molybdopterin molybdotransferase